MPPVIGITSESPRSGKIHLRLAYVSPFVEMGCVPVIIPSVESDYREMARRLARALDGIVLTGGGDIDPAYFSDGRTCTLLGVSHERDAVEMALIGEFLLMDKPVLGICRGSQILNVAAGGSLIQDIQSRVPGALCHRRSGIAEAGLHPVEIRAGTILEGLFGTTRIDVNSRHHQAVDRLAPGFAVSAVAPDGVIEGIASPSHKFAVGVQWHPEDLYPGVESVALFRGFVESCREGIG